MKCGALLTLSFCLLSASLWAQSDAGLSLPVQPAPISSDSIANYKTLDEILTELEMILSESADSSEKVKLLVTELQSRLAESRMQVAEVSISLESSVKSLESSSRDLISLYRKQRLEIWIWRGVSMASIIGLITIGLSR